MRVLWAIARKEWLGLRWKLAALTAILLAPLLATLVYEPVSVPTSFVPLLIFYGAIASIFLAMHAAAEDHSAGTLEFVRGLPMPLARWGAVRVLATLGVLLVPVIAAGTFTYAAVAVMSWWKPTIFALSGGMFGLDLLTSIAVTTLAGMSVSASLFLWTTALAMNQPSELRAGLIGVATAVAWGVCTLLAAVQWHNGSGNSAWPFGLTSLGPFAGLVILDSGLTGAGRVAIGIGQLAAMSILVVVAARRYGILESRRRAPFLRPASPEGALWWMQWRQAWPLGLTGLGIILGFAILGFVTGNAHDNLMRFQMLLYYVSIVFGACWAIVVAVPLFSSELEPRLVAFWRSRPIDPATWFRIKYLTGALTLLVFIDLPALCLGRHENSPSQDVGFLAFLTCVPALHLAIYSVAVLIACVVRHTIYSGILSLGAVLFFVVAPPAYGPNRGLLARSSFIDVMKNVTQALDQGSVPPDWLLTLVIYLAFTATLAIVATLLARRAIQRDYAVRA